MLKTIIIQGSSRSKGNTYTIASLIKKLSNADSIDLSDKNIHHYTYDHRHQDDDFMPLMRQIVEYDLIILATPIYWYTMSGMMKVFLDRISDCLKVDKDLGRQLRGKQLAAICCGSDATEIEGYFVPFQLSAAYLGMDYRGGLHTWMNDGHTPPKEVISAVERFVKTWTE